MLIKELLDSFMFELRTLVKNDVGRLIAMLNPIKDEETGEKIYQVVDISDDHHAKQFCVYCEKDVEVLVARNGNDENMFFCEECGFEIWTEDV